jgi:hypothetical protein
MSKMQYKALGLLVGVLGGMLASAIVRKMWELTPGHDEAPEAIDTRRSWSEILTAAALQGAIFAVIRAAVERATAASAEKLTGEQPGAEVNASRRRRPGRSDQAGHHWPKARILGCRQDRHKSEVLRLTSNAPVRGIRQGVLAGQSWWSGAGSNRRPSASRRLCTSRRVHYRPPDWAV